MLKDHSTNKHNLCLCILCMSVYLSVCTIWYSVLVKNKRAYNNKNNDNRLTSMEEDLSVVRSYAEERCIFMSSMSWELISYTAVESGVAVFSSHLYQHASDRCVLRYFDVIDRLFKFWSVVVSVNYRNVDVDWPSTGRLSTVDRIQCHLYPGSFMQEY